MLGGLSLAFALGAGQYVANLMGQSDLARHLNLHGEWPEVEMLSHAVFRVGEQVLSMAENAP